MSQFSLPALTDNQRQELTDSRSPFTAEDRVAIAMCWLTSGGHAAKAAHRASQLCEREVDAGTIRKWRSRTWWPQAEELGRQALQKDLDAKYTQLLNETTKEILDRVKEGDWKIVNGEKVRVPVSMRDLVGGHAIVSDKRAMIRGEPTSRKEDTGLALAQQLLDLLHQRGEKHLRDALPGEYEVVTDDEVDIRSITGPDDGLDDGVPG